MTSEVRTAVARLMRPQSIAVVGVSPEPGSFGATMVSSLESFRYPGALHLVSRTRREAFGRPCVAAIDDLPVGIDLAVLCVPGEAICEAIQACGRRGIAGAIVFASGFAETGEAGRAGQQELAAAARQAGVAVLGPNCLGFINHVDAVALCPPFPRPVRDRNPSVGFLTQSGAMMMAAGDALRAAGVGLSHVFSTGNEAVLGVEDFLAELIDDEATRVIALFIEQIRRPRRFLELAALARDRRKPIVMFHSGHTPQAQAAAQSHTGALAGDFRVMAALTAHQGVILADSFDELIDVTRLLSRFPAPPTAGVAVVTNSGAFRGIAFDVCAAAGLDVPKLSGPVLERIGAMMPAYMTPDNPLDVGTLLIRTPDLLGAVSEAMIDDPNVGSLVVGVVLGRLDQAVDKARAAHRVLAGADKPVAFGAIGGDAAPPEFFAEFADHRVPVFRSAERALRAMGRITAYGRALQRWSGRSAAPSALRLPPLPGRGVLTEHAAKSYMAALGIAVPEGALASDAVEAARIAERIGYPVALKAQSADLPHKSDAGGVVLGIPDGAALAAAWDRLHAAVAAARPGLRLDGVLVERMSPPGLEMIVGTRRDPNWGPVVAVGFGGVLVEVLDDIRLIAPDVTPQDVLDELGRLRGARLFQGVRGAPPSDVAALAGVVQKVAELMRCVPEVLEIDLNPVMVYPKGACALDALVVTQP